MSEAEKIDLQRDSYVQFTLREHSLVDATYDDLDLIQEWNGKIIYRHCDDDLNESPDKIVGRIKGLRVDLGEALERSTHPFDVFDSHSGALCDYYATFFDDGDLREDLELGTLGDILIINSVEVSKKYRGRGLGLLAVRKALQAFGGGCALSAIKPFPLNFANEVTEKNQAEFDFAQQKLRDYWSRLGFVRCRDTEYYYLDMTHKRVPLGDLLRKEEVRDG